MTEHNWLYLDVKSGKFKDLSQIKYKKKVKGHPVTSMPFPEWQYLLDNNGELWDGIDDIREKYIPNLPVMELQKPSKNGVKVMTAKGIEYTYYPGELFLECLVIPHESTTYTTFLGTKRERNTIGQIVGCQIININDYLETMQKRMRIPEREW